MIQISPTVIQDAFWWEVRFPFSWDAVVAVKKIPGRSYDPERRVWLIPGLPAAEDALHSFLTSGGHV